MTEKLFRMAQEAPGIPTKESDWVCSLVWAPQSFTVPTNAGWLLATIPRSHAEPQRVFVVDEVSFYVSAAVEPLLRDKVFDWDDSKGMMSHAA
jgi:hypothetical protein